MKPIQTITTLILLIVLNISCTSTKATTYWINSIKKECNISNGNMQCLQIYKGENLEAATWSYFDTSIEGFSFESGYFQKIKVLETTKVKSNVPADASTINYKLIKVLEKKEDNRMALNDIWVVTHINEEAILNSDNYPNLEINLSKMQVFGSDGCNNYRGDIKNITSETITFGPLAATRKMCYDMTIPDKFNDALNNCVSYKRDNLKLYLYDSNNNKLLSFKKVD